MIVDYLWHYFLFRSNPFTQPLCSLPCNPFNLLLSKYRMPHIFAVHRRLVLRLADLLQVKGSERIDHFVNSCLEKNIRWWKIFKKLTYFVHRVEDSTHRARHQSFIIVVRVVVDSFVLVVLGAILSVSLEKTGSWAYEAEELADFLEKNLFFLEITKCGSQ